METKEYRLLVLYISENVLKAGVFDNQKSVCEKTFPAEIAPAFQPGRFHEASLKLLASLDEEGINISKLNAVCTVNGQGEGMNAEEKCVSFDRKSIENGKELARNIAEGLNVSSFFIPVQHLEQERAPEENYLDDPILRCMAGQVLKKLKD
ncbi:butyrate kinase [Bacillus ectoiniformans]|uniref:hypothetical protein n=1 Tax=Bacillus ectoiniformans TaxID=1494429 RepID=UPI0019574457|nr:hypothetical protein [Bacillus ectoiniformans]MBM7648119.1 butyrate kinase [Bacillus ectoiniformans]